jgi:uncharacterized glyoxalase superfamily protein PhnB
MSYRSNGRKGVRAPLSLTGKSACRRNAGRQRRNAWQKSCTARLEGPGVLFYASDNDDTEPMRGSAHILMIEDKEKTVRLFGKLKEGGRVTTPLGMQPWEPFTES